MSEKRVYTFGNGQAEGNAQMRERLGGKGANLAEMNLIGIPVPPGFTIATDVCNEYSIRSRLLISTTSTFPARTASITSCRAGQSRAIPEPCSAAAPTMVYPACSA